MAPLLSALGAGCWKARHVAVEGTCADPAVGPYHHAAVVLHRHDGGAGVWRLSRSARLAHSGTAAPSTRLLSPQRYRAAAADEASFKGVRTCTRQSLASLE